MTEELLGVGAEGVDDPGLEGTDLGGGHLEGRRWR